MSRYELCVGAPMSLPLEKPAQTWDVCLSQGLDFYTVQKLNLVILQKLTCHGRGARPYSFSHITSFFSKPGIVL